MKVVLLFVLFLKINEQNAEETRKNILCIFSMASPSHHIWNKALKESLASKGHNITALSITTEQTTNPNLHYLELDGIYEALYSGDKPFDLLEFAQKSVLGITKDTIDFFIKICRASLKSKGVKTLLNYPDNFKVDLVIFDYTNLPCLHGFVAKFNHPPQIGVTAFANPVQTSDMTGSPNFASIKPHYVTNLGASMTFLERLYNSMHYIFDVWQRRFSIWWVNAEVQVVFKDKTLNIGDLENDVDLVLVSSHSGMDIPEPVLPNIIQVAGLQIKEPKPLSNDLKQFIESSTKGAVLFSLGTNLKSEIIGDAKINMFISAISRFSDYNFLWKIELKNKTFPKNMLVRQWMPQNDILAHPKIKLFITHGGLLSSQEATWHGVPILGMPFFVDQYTNVQKSVDAGVGERLDFMTLTEDIIVEKLEKLLQKNSYKEKMLLRSKRFRDRPMHPLQEAVWWCEYIIRHKGAPHLKSQARYMDASALFMWDILVVLLAAAFTVLYLMYAIIRRIVYKKENVYDDKKIN
uniref:Putative udp-glucoronosyl and udp-glucosyl transferase n=1 Tax=Xenopsylla cheopis TaxID=163159 RepID=A0A6M2DX19_XENCH